ncbi:MAG: wax ester/triacylglycerol synthase family O-acyltransferase [Gammaproteobacteria bacterium]|nr:wax ester/triacylglycerol synthase family O-acyltransferase [Gammaproteobacteria bacterium]
MQQLSGIDANFLYIENGNNFSHISGLAIYDPSTAPRGKVRFKAIMARVAECTGRVPMLSRRLKTVPFEADFPYWVQDEAFDPEFHIRHLSLPQPGDWRQLCIEVARIHSRPLDRSRPLWEMHVIEGLDKVEGFPNNSFAILTKMHHAAVDGAASVELQAAIHDLEPNPKTKRVASEKPMAEAEPSTASLLWRANINNIKRPQQLFRFARKAAPSLLKYVSGVRSGELKQVDEAPKTRFNGNVSPHRVFLAENFKIDDIKAIKNSVPGATINDVAITLCGGALRKYLLAHDELPEKSLIAIVPVNVRSDDSKGKDGNHVSMMKVRLYSTIEDARQRLEAVQKGNSEAKELNKAVGAKMMIETTQLIAPSLVAAGMKAANRFGVMGDINAGANTVVTNVPGLQVPVYFCGAKMIHTYGMGNCLDGLGLFQAVTSYCDNISFSAAACREMMPDPELFAQFLRESFNELMAQVDS